MPPHNKSLLFIGSLGKTGEIASGGAVVKNRILLSFLEPKYAHIRTVNVSLGFKTNPFNPIKLLFFLIFPQRNEDIVLTAYMDLSYFILRICRLIPQKKKIIYCVTGGYMPWRIESGEYKKVFFRQVHSFVCETEKMCEKLRELGFNNCTKLYNYKWKPKKDYAALKTILPIRFVYLGRVVFDKGLPFLFHLWGELNKMHPADCPPLDIYGPVENSYKEAFFHSLSQSSNVYYKGIINTGNEDNYLELRKYTALLFPTEHQNEGFPGIIIDAAICGLPILTTPFQGSQELIISRNLGIELPVGSIKQWCDAINQIIDKPSSLEPYRSAGREHASDFFLEYILTDVFWEKATK